MHDAPVGMAHGPLHLIGLYRKVGPGPGGHAARSWDGRGQGQACSASRRSATASSGSPTWQRWPARRSSSRPARASRSPRPAPANAPTLAAACAARRHAQHFYERRRRSRALHTFVARALLVKQEVGGFARGVHFQGLSAWQARAARAACPCSPQHPCVGRTGAGGAAGAGTHGPVSSGTSTGGGGDSASSAGRAPRSGLRALPSACAGGGGAGPCAGASRPPACARSGWPRGPAKGAPAECAPGPDPDTGAGCELGAEPRLRAACAGVRRALRAGAWLLSARAWRTTRPDHHTVRVHRASQKAALRNVPSQNVPEEGATLARSTAHGLRQAAAAATRAPALPGSRPGPTLDTSACAVQCRGAGRHHA